MNNLFMPLSLVELDELNELIFKYVSEDDDDFLNSVTSLTELDGFFTAILSSPEMLQPSQWLPALWNNSPPEWEHLETFNHFISLVMRYYNEVNTSLKMGAKYYHAQFEVREIEGQEWIVTEDWSYAYMMGRKLFKIPKLPDDIEAALAFIEQDGTIENNEEILSKLPSTAKESAERAEKIERAALHIYEYVDNHIYKPSLTKRKNKIGVNEPCPCGSGKKYKKCCLNKE